jgi:membrane peptidoglycan carboxypeptidase
MGTAIQDQPDRPHAQSRQARESQPWLFNLTALVVGLFAVIGAIVLVLWTLGPQVAANVTGSVDAEILLPDDTDFERLRERSYVYAADGSLLATLQDEITREVVEFDDLPDHVWQAVVAAEDRRFFEHEGYDIEGIGRAFVTNVRAREISQGGSTITQQLAKLNFLDASQTIERKFAELLQAMALERELSKEQLLERYLNQVYFGGGTYGIQAAAEKYFDVDAAELEPQQAALLAGFIRSPSLFDPYNDPDSALDRRNQVPHRYGRGGLPRRGRGGRPRVGRPRRGRTVHGRDP